MKINSVPDKLPEDSKINIYVNVILKLMQDTFNEYPDKEYEFGGEYAMILSLPAMDGGLQFSVQKKLNEIFMALENITLSHLNLRFTVASANV